jgi:hypothetical protein
MSDEIIPVEHQRGGATRLVARSRSCTCRPRATTCGSTPTSGRFLVRAALSDDRAALARARLRARAPQLRREPAPGGRDPARARRRRDVVLSTAARSRSRAARSRTCAEGCGCEQRQAADPGPRRARGRRVVLPPRDELAEATAHGEVYLRRLRQRTAALSLLALVAFGAVFGVLPIALYLLPQLHRVRLLDVPVALWLLVVPLLPLFLRSAGCTPGAPTRSTTPSAIWSNVDRAPRGRRRHARDARPRHLGRALRADDLGPARRLAGGHRVVERGGDLRRVPVGGELPGDRRPGDADRRSALWQSLGFTAGYLALLLFVAAPLRRFGSYTIPDFAEARLRSPRLRLLAAGIVLLIGGFYLVPQLKGAGLALNVVSARRTGSASSSSGRSCRQRRDRRHARDHLRAGVPVLGQGVRDLGAGDPAADPLRRPAGAGGAVRRAPAGGLARVRRQAACVRDGRRSRRPGRSRSVVGWYGSRPVAA